VHGIQTHAFSTNLRVTCDVISLQGLALAWGTTYRWLCEPVDYSETPEAYAVSYFDYKVKGKGHPHNRPQGPKGVPGRLRPRIFLTFGTTRVVGRQLHAPAAFTLRGNPWYSFLEAESTPGHMVPSVATEKIPSVTTRGIDPETVRLVAQCLSHYAAPGPIRERANTKNTQITN
jgi:hypothetical protein